MRDESHERVCVCADLKRWMRKEIDGVREKELRVRVRVCYFGISSREFPSSLVSFRLPISSLLSCVPASLDLLDDRR